MVYSSRPTFGMSRKPFNSTIPPETRPLQAEQWQLRRYLYPLPLNVQRGTTIPITKVSCHQRNITCPSLAIAFFLVQLIFPRFKRLPVIQLILMLFCNSLICKQNYNADRPHSVILHFKSLSPVSAPCFLGILCPRCPCGYGVNEY